MRVRIFKTWDRLSSSFWFIPAVMAGGAITLAFVNVALDAPATNWLQREWGWTFTGGAEGATAVLGTIAASMITIAGVVFSMTLVALSLASAQLGPRLLRNFMRDTTTQAVLGTFIATFLYCLLVLRTIRRVDEVAFVPHLSVALGVLLAVASVGVLIYFIHHVSVSIQANEIVSRVGKELIAGIDDLYPENMGGEVPQVPKGPPDAGLLDALAREGRPVGAAEDGYIQFIDGDELVDLAAENDVIIRVERGPGHYVVATCPLVLVWPGKRSSEQFAEKVNSMFALGYQRTSGQDLGFLVDQLVEIAVRALSTGVNDPFTATVCLDNIGSALCRLVQRDMPSPFRYDAQDQLRVITPVVTFSDLTDAAFNPIRQYGRSSAAVTNRLLDTIALVARFAHRPADRATLLRHAEMITRGAGEGLPEAQDRRAVEERCLAVRQLCSEPAGSGR